MLRYPGQFADQFAHELRQPYSVTATTLTRCEVHRIDVDHLLEAGRRNPEVSAFEKYMLKGDLYNVCLSNIAMKTLGSTDLLEHALWEIAIAQTRGKATPPLEFILPLTNREMAEWLGMSESHYKQTRTALEAARRLRRTNGRRFVLLHDRPLHPV